VCTVHTPFDIRSAKALLKDEGYQVRIHEKSFTVRIPPRGIEIVRVQE
jgi:hypothetical protein